MWPYPLFAIYNMKGQRITAPVDHMQTFEAVIQIAQNEKKYHNGMFRVEYEKDEGEAEHYCFLTV